MDGQLKDKDASRLVAMYFQKPVINFNLSITAEQMRC